MSARERVLQDKEQRKQQAMLDHEANLERARIQTAKANIEASYAQKNQYKHNGQSLVSNLQLAD
jgi:hypothetical protein